MTKTANGKRLSSPVVLNRLRKSSWSIVRGVILFGLCFEILLVGVELVEGLDDLYVAIAGIKIGKSGTSVLGFLFLHLDLMELRLFCEDLFVVLVGGSELFVKLVLLLNEVHNSTAGVAGVENSLHFFSYSVCGSLGVYLFASGEENVFDSRLYRTLGDRRVSDLT